jgi:hypothetical protein
LSGPERPADLLAHPDKPPALIHLAGYKLPVEFSGFEQVVGCHANALGLLWVGAIDALADIKPAERFKPIFLSDALEVDFLDEHAAESSSSLYGIGAVESNLSTNHRALTVKTVKAVRTAKVCRSQGLTSRHIRFIQTGAVYVSC